MRETTFENAKVGDAVYDLKYGEGIIEKMNEGGYPEHIGVRFKDSSYHGFSFAGYEYYTSNRTLFWSRPEIIVPERPVREEWVEVEVRPVLRDGEIMFYFSHVNEKNPIFFNDKWCGPVQTVKVKVER